MTTMTDEHDVVRQQSFDCDGPVDIDIELGSGSIDVQFADEAGDAGGQDAAEDTADAAEGTEDTAYATETADAAHAADTADATEAAQDTADATAAAEDTNTAGDGDGEPAQTAAETAADAAPAIVVEVRHEPRAGANWGLTGLLNWVGGQLGTVATDLATEAVRETIIELHGNRLTVRGPRSAPLRGVPLAVVVYAPGGSSLSTRSGSAGVRVGGPAGRVHVNTGSGDVSVDRAAAAVQVKTGSGTVRLGPMADGLSARTGSGDLEVTSLSGSGALHSGSGDIWIGTVHGGRVTARTGSGDLTVADAAAGLLQLVTGSGDLRVGIRTGVLAEVDVVSGSGRARSDLPVSHEPPSGGEAVLNVRARTGSGDAVVSAATA